MGPGYPGVVALSGCEVLFCGAAQLKDPRSADRHGEQPATDCSQQNGHAQRQAPMPGEERKGRRRRVLRYEDQQHDQGQEPGNQR